MPLFLRPHSCSKPQQTSQRGRGKLGSPIAPELTSILMSKCTDCQPCLPTLLGALPSGSIAGQALPFAMPPSLPPYWRLCWLWADGSEGEQITSTLSPSPEKLLCWLTSWRCWQEMGLTECQVFLKKITSTKGQYCNEAHPYIIFFKNFPKSYSCVPVGMPSVWRSELSDTGGEQAWTSGRQTRKRDCFIYGECQWGLKHLQDFQP